MTGFFYIIVAFFAGIFLGNAVPHFIQGISGNKFPTPFATPPGRGLSSAPVNMIWALFNFLIGCLLLKMGLVNLGDTLSCVAFFVGVAVISVFSSIIFQKKEEK